MSKSVEYELITRAIFQALVDQDEARNIAVQHDVTLRGKFLEHQVDVYWKVEIGGVEHQTVIECKDWNRRLEQEKLLAFRSKLEDLYSPVGVMVTRSGYQSGALEYANKHGIYLYELFEQPPLVVTEGSFGRYRLKVVQSAPDELWNKASQVEPPLFPNLILEFTYFEPQYSDNIYHADNDWLRDQVRRVGEHLKGELQQFTLPKQPLSSLKLYDETQTEVGSMFDVFRERAKEMFDVGLTSESFIHRFSNPTFLKTDMEFLPYLKITGVSTNIAIMKHEPVERPMRREGFVNFILRSLQDGKERVIAVRQ